MKKKRQGPSIDVKKGQPEPANLLIHVIGHEKKTLSSLTRY